MKNNVGRIDRVVRLLVGLAVVGAGLYFKNPLGLLGLIFVATAAIGWCPLYLPFGINTCKKDNKL